MRTVFKWETSIGCWKVGKMQFMNSYYVKLKVSQLICILKVRDRGESESPHNGNNTRMCVRSL